jgi:hypothetical protein
MSKEFTRHLEKQGTVCRLVVHNSPQQNGKAEHLNRTIVEHARTLLFDASLPKSLWPEAIRHAVYLQNQTTTVQTKGTTPYKQAMGQKPDLSKLRRFGETVWIRVKDAGKLHPKLKAARWLGVDSESKVHRVYWEGTQHISVKRNVRFGDKNYTIISVEGENRVNLTKTTRNNGKLDKQRTEGEKKSNNAPKSIPTTKQSASQPPSPLPSINDVTEPKSNDTGNDIIHHESKPESKAKTQPLQRSSHTSKPSK